jgi:hypothetical protein
LAFNEWFDDANGVALYHPPPVIRGPTPTTAKGTIELEGVIPDALMHDGPHLIWINFLDELYASTKGSSIDCMELVASCVLKALGNPKKLSQKVTSFGARFRLLKLALQMLQDSESAPSLVLGIYIYIFEYIS